MYILQNISTYKVFRKKPWYEKLLLQQDIGLLEDLNLFVNLVAVLSDKWKCNLKFSLSLRLLHYFSVGMISPEYGAHFDPTLWLSDMNEWKSYWF